MSDLHLALFAVAALLLLALYLSEKWKERRLLRRLRDRLHGGVRDALLGAGTADLRDPSPIADAGAVPVRGRPGRVEPSLGIQPIEPAEAPAPTHTADEQGWPTPQSAAPAALAEPQVSSEALRAPAALLRPDWVEDPLLDCSLEIRCARAVDGVSVIDAAAVLAHTAWRLPVHFVVWDGRHQQWVLPDRFGYYTDALASIQLADRHGRIEEAELIRFVQIVQQVANTLDADVDAPDIQKLLEQAQELDRLCARFDMKIGMTVESSGAAWTGPQMRSAAQQAHFVATNGQRWVHYDAQGEALYALEADTVSMKRLMLEFDIAVAPIAANGFGSMVESATALAAMLGGRVVDDNGDPIESNSLATVQTQLARLYEEMVATGIEPGSVRARRMYV
ncbi:MAG TPA: cell division protein ZipA C-terminal FtsZ-binding domain-containing protein [Burkholderiaceae bacterium]|nr:cell division protein ZipA C-terminal FtsZ-binding domain-containing protein [Burkholderiaceae bacterium]